VEEYDLNLEYIKLAKKKLPRKYTKGLNREEESILKKEIKNTLKKDTKDPSAYKEWDSDKRYKSRGNKTQESEYTKKFKEMFSAEVNASVDDTLSDKAKKSGISKTILKKVFSRGMGAWRSGHRPGVSPHQWAMARVNSFITGGKTRSTADKDLWEKNKSNKK
jgi:hypothetical protein